MKELVNIFVMKKMIIIMRFIKIINKKEYPLKNKFK